MLHAASGAHEEVTPWAMVLCLLLVIGFLAGAAVGQESGNNLFPIAAALPLERLPPVNDGIKFTGFTEAPPEKPIPSPLPEQDRAQRASESLFTPPQNPVVAASYQAGDPGLAEEK